jgi:hypothetical protein
METLLRVGGATLVAVSSIAFEHMSFQVNDDPGLKLVIYTPVPTDGAN